MWFWPVPEVLCTFITWEELGENVDELPHLLLLSGRWMIRVIRGHSVQKGPSAAAQLFPVQRTLGILWLWICSFCLLQDQHRQSPDEFKRLVASCPVWMNDLWLFGYHKYILISLQFAGCHHNQIFKQWITMLRHHKLYTVEVICQVSSLTPLCHLCGTTTSSCRLLLLHLYPRFKVRTSPAWLLFHIPGLLLLFTGAVLRWSASHWKGESFKRRGHLWSSRSRGRSHAYFTYKLIPLTEHLTGMDV